MTDLSGLDFHIFHSVLIVCPGKGHFAQWNCRASGIFILRGSRPDPVVFGYGTHLQPVPGSGRAKSCGGLVSRMRRGADGTGRPACGKPAGRPTARGGSSRHRTATTPRGGRDHYAAIGLAGVGNQGLVSSPTAWARRAWRSSKVQKCCAFNSRAQATWSESRVRTPRVGP